MSKVITRMDPEMRAILLEAVQAFIAAIPDGALVEGTVSRGVDEFAEPISDVMRHRINGTMTLQVLVNGGTRDRDTSGDELMAHVLRIAETL